MITVVPARANIPAATTAAFHILISLKCRLARGGRVAVPLSNPIRSCSCGLLQLQERSEMRGDPGYRASRPSGLPAVARYAPIKPHHLTQNVTLSPPVPAAI